mmetsp:Transcript_88418/g.270634  ORF Transcript_88418/g.270634 Transcript_88418/m.270634 type:complete len:224 (+) Transcript_88418:468-1139(+)
MRTRERAGADEHRRLRQTCAFGAPRVGGPRLAGRLRRGVAAAFLQSQIRGDGLPGGRLLPPACGRQLALPRALAGVVRRVPGLPGRAPRCGAAHLPEFLHNRGVLDRQKRRGGHAGFHRRGDELVGEQFRRKAHVHERGRRVRSRSQAHLRQRRARARRGPRLLPEGAPARRGGHRARCSDPLGAEGHPPLRRVLPPDRRRRGAARTGAADHWRVQRWGPRGR